MMAPTSVYSRLSARPVPPLPKSSISLSMASVRPSIFATPSPISRTMPTFCFITDVFTPVIWASISCSRLLINVQVVGDGLEATGPAPMAARPSPNSKFVRQLRQAPADTPVVNVAPHLHAQTADQTRVQGEGNTQPRTVFARQIRLHAGPEVFRKLNGAFDSRRASRD